MERELILDDHLDFLVSSTIDLSNSRHFKLKGNAQITGNFDGYLLKLYESLFTTLEGVRLKQVASTSNSGCLKVSSSYSCSFRDLFLYGGYTTLFHKGNNNLFERVTARFGVRNFYTEADGNNVANTFIACAFELATQYNAVFDVYSTESYGEYSFRDCYFEKAGIGKRNRWFG